LPYNYIPVLGLLRLSDGVNSRYIYVGRIYHPPRDLDVGLQDAHAHPAIGADLARDGDQLASDPHPLQQFLDAYGVAGRVDDDDGVLVLSHRASLQQPGYVAALSKYSLP
jgi:hypothetical protein